jgi:exopolysaccharide production protein ExoZ
VIRPIQYLRALAALSVVWGHSLYSIQGAAQQLGAPWFGASGVDLFFVISGFIMVVTTDRADVTPLRFLALRVIRVVPLYWLATLAWIAYTALAESTACPPAAIVKSLLFVPYRSAGPPAGVWPILQNGWTLNFEMFFYLLFALALAAPRRLGTAALALTLVALVATGRLFGPFSQPLASTYTSPYLSEFVAGMILAHGWRKGEPRDSLLQSLVLIAFGCYCLGGLHSRLTIVGGAFLVVAGSLNPKFAAIESRPLMALGNASYSIYLIHQLVLAGLVPLWTGLFPVATTLSSVCFLVLALLACALGGLLCYRWIERPLLARLRKLIGTRAARPPSRSAHGGEPVAAALHGREP